VDETSPVRARLTLRATITGVGSPGPIEERLGRRLVRLVDPDSREGSALLRSGRVTFVGPEGLALDCADLAEARRLLRARMERRLADDCDTTADRSAIEDGLARLGRTHTRMGRG
jgi:hypothetical protein